MTHNPKNDPEASLNHLQTLRPMALGTKLSASSVRRTGSTRQQLHKKQGSCSGTKCESSITELTHVRADKLYSLRRKKCKKSSETYAGRFRLGDDTSSHKEINEAD